MVRFSNVKMSGSRTSYVWFSNGRPIPFDNQTFLSGFRMVRAILKPDIKNVRFSNDSGIRMSGFSDCDCNGRKTNTNFIDVTHMTSRTENKTKPRDLQKSYPNIIFFLLGGHRMMNHHGLNDKMEDLNHQMVLAAATAAANGPSNYGLQLFYTHLTF